MRLKRLSLFGFKSFAHRTELLFAPGITAVVGPNGSGKSNLLDAILWVLGERSTKSLRSPKAADLLFAGNGKVKPASLAEVALTLELDADHTAEPADNDRWISALSEVVISRRLKRSGESQFSINRVPCRLRDVQDLLLELGLGPDSYAFITQAEIDRLVFLPPQERRALIEQAAGVHRFQVRREDALEKLDRTERNLTRLRDLLAELHRQREALTVEVEKAHRYRHLLQRQRELQLALLGWEHQVRLRRVERLNEERTALAQQLTECDREHAALTAQRQQVERALAAMEANLQTLQRDAALAVEMAKAVEGEVALCRERQTHLTARHTQLERQQANLAERHAKLLAERDEVARQLTALQQQQEQFASAETALQGELQRAHAEVAALERQLQDGHDDLFEAERAIAEAKSQLAALEPLVRTLQNRAEEVRREHAAVQERLARARQRWDELNAELAALHSAESDAALHRAQHQLAEATTLRDQLQAQLNALREQLAAAKARLAALEEMELSLSGVPQGARAVLLAVRNGQLSGEFHLLAHLLQVPAGLEIAYEAALGAAANYLVAPTFAEVQSAIELLKNTNAGRATFLALDFLAELFEPSRPSPSVPAAEGVIGWAHELVQVTDERFVQAVRHVLRNTLLVDDLTVARRLAPQLRGVRFVTRSGEVVAPSGTIAGGAVAQGSGNIFQRRRERDELTHRIRQWEAQASEFLVQLHAAERHIAELQEKVARRQHQRQERQRRAEQLSAERDRCAAEMNRWQQEQQRLDAETQRLQRERQQLQNDATALEQRLAQLMAWRDAAQQRVQQLQSALSEAVLRRDTLTGQWQQLQMSAAQWRTQHDALRQRLSALDDAIAEMTQQQQALGQEKATVADELRALADRLLALEQQLQELHRRRTETEAALAEWHQRRQALLQQRDDLDQQLTIATQRRQAVADELHRCEMRLAEAEAERTALERRLAEEFNVTPEVAHSAAQQVSQKQAALDELERVRRELAQMGDVRLGVLDEHERLTARIAFLDTQVADLESAKATLLSQLSSLEQQFRERFRAVLDQVNEHFNAMVHHFWRGGEGRLSLTEGTTLADSGVEVRVHLPGKAEQDLMALSGGEKAIVGLCLLFALLKINPAPFVLLDEVDAPLDDANTDRFVALLREFADRTQFIVITHNPVTVQAADHLYGVTMEDDGISRVLSLSLREALAWAERQ